MCALPQAYIDETAPHQGTCCSCSHSWGHSLPCILSFIPVHPCPSEVQVGTPPSSCVLVSASQWHIGSLLPPAPCYLWPSTGHTPTTNLGLASCRRSLDTLATLLQRVLSGQRWRSSLLLRPWPVVWVFRAARQPWPWTACLLDCLLGSRGSLWLRRLKMALEMVILREPVKSVPRL